MDHDVQADAAAALKALKGARKWMRLIAHARIPAAKQAMTGSNKHNFMSGYICIYKDVSTAQ